MSNCLFSLCLKLSYLFRGELQHNIVEEKTILNLGITEKLNKGRTCIKGYEASVQTLYIKLITGLIHSSQCIVCQAPPVSVNAYLSGPFVALNIHI